MDHIIATTPQLIEQRQISKKQNECHLGTYMYMYMLMIIFTLRFDEQTDHILLTVFSAILVDTAEIF